AIIGDRNKTVLGHLDLDPVCMAGKRLVHGVVDDFGEQMVQCFFIGAADIHSRPSAHRFEALEHLDVLGRVTRVARRATRGATAGAVPACLRRVEQVGHFRGFGGLSHGYSQASPMWSVVPSGAMEHPEGNGESTPIASITMPSARQKN